MTDDRSLRVAVLQHDASLKGPETRYSWLEQQARTLAETGNDLLVCPELYMSGYDVGDELLACAEPVDGPFAARVSVLARETDMAIVYGYPERDGNTHYNAALCIGADGEVLANHRKTVLPPGFESQYFTAGKAFTAASIRSVRVGIVICYEVEFPESVRGLARLGAEVVVAPTALGMQWDQVASRVVPARAFENGVYVVYANHAGREGQSHFLGGSCIIDPVGRDVTRAGQEAAIVTAALDISAVGAAQARLPFLIDCDGIPRRPA